MEYSQLGLPQIRLVLGTGRSGSWSWYRILQAQSGYVQSSHEGLPFPWEVDRAVFFWLCLKAFVQWIGTPIWSNSSFAWIRYIGPLMQTFKNPKCAVMDQGRDRMVASFMRHWKYENHWTDPESKHWDNEWPKATFENPIPETLTAMFPKYDLPKEDAIAAYYDEYFAMARYWQNRLPESFKIFDMLHALNTEEGMDEVLAFFDVPEKYRRYFVGVRINAQGRHRGILYKEIDDVHGPIRIHEDVALVRQETFLSLQQRFRAVRGDVQESVGETDPAVSGPRGEGWVQVPE